MDDFEAFRKRKQAEKAAQQETQKSEAAFDEAAKKMGWVDGIGFVGANNPKVKGFLVGRARRKRVDPNSLVRPKKIESHRVRGKKVDPSTIKRAETEERRRAREKPKVDPSTVKRIEREIVSARAAKPIDPSTLQRPEGLESHRPAADEKKPVAPAPKPKGLQRF
ncbi:MAG: hypothetical protein M9894_10810 [Planctomycetes bacterium]|nr:hypothetical protein [Planctomycetota bacterium]